MTNADTPLHSAVRSFNPFSGIVSFKLLLGQHVNDSINAVNSEGETPLHLAARNTECYPEVIKLLLEHGADVRATTPRSGNTALHWVAMNSSISSGSAVKILVKHGADVDVVNLEGDTPLHLAARNESVNAAVLELLEHVSDVNLKNFNGDTPLHLHLQNRTLMCSFVRTSKFVRKCSNDVNVTNSKGETPLHLAVRNKSFYSYITPYCNVLLTKLLIDHGADGSKRDATGENAYEAYCNAADKDNGRPDPMLQILLQSNELEGHVKSSLHVACLFHNVDSVHKLLRFGVDVNAIDKFGYSPLFYALIAHGDSAEKLANKCSTVRLLLDYGADINHQFTRSNLSLSTLVIHGIKEMDDKDYRAMHYIFFKHMAKLLTLHENPVEIELSVEVMRQYKGYYSGTSQEIAVHNIEEFNVWRSRCSQELNAMSEIEVGVSGLTFLDLMFASAKKTAIYAKNKKLVEAFRDKKGMFPMYQGMLDAKLARHLERLKLVESAADVLRNLLKLVNLSDESIEMTLSYCSNEDLIRVTCGTGEIEERLKSMNMLRK